jgi:putative addiction module component (TIGR02574 family)
MWKADGRFVSLFVHCAGAETPGRWILFHHEQTRNFGRTAEAHRPDRQEIRQKLNEIDDAKWMDGDEPLTDDEKSLLEVRLATYEKEPDAGSSWEEVEAHIRGRIRG